LKLDYSAFLPEELDIAKYLNPIKGLKRSVAIGPAALYIITKHLNPIKGLKSVTYTVGQYPVIFITKHLNPIKGLK